MEHSLFTEISLVIAIAAFVGLAMKLLRQPMVIGYILTGIIVGPAVLDIVHSESTFEVFATIGIALLLFIIGLGLNPKVVKEVGRAAVLTGVGQIIFTTLFGYGLVTLLGYSSLEALFIAVALTFSSTIIVLKLLSDKKEQGRLYGKIAVGFLLVQDVVATMALVIASTNSEGGSGITDVLVLLLKGGLIGAGLFLASTFVLPRLSKLIAESTEFLFLFSIGWGFGVATLFAQAGFSIEVGALFAGVSLAPMVYAQEVGSRLRPLRDFFIVLFFVALGANLNLDSVVDVLPEAMLLSAFVLIGNPFIVISIMGLLGYTKKTSFKAGLTVAQISEFSLIFILLGNSQGNVSDETVSLVTMVALITIAFSTYMIIYADTLYNYLERYLALFERRKTKSERRAADRHDAILFGYKKGGSEFIKVFKKMKARYMVIDYDPEVIDHLEHSRIPYIYGDAMDAELLDEANVYKAKLVVSTINDHPANLFLIAQLKKENPSAVVILHSDNPKDAKELYELGATYVMIPHYIGSEQIGSFIMKNGFKKSEFKKYRDKHLEYITKNPS
jgi:Kef-type K+ transport system membrane component KefB